MQDRYYNVVVNREKGGDEICVLSIGRGGGLEESHLNGYFESN